MSVGQPDSEGGDRQSPSPQQYRSALSRTDAAAETPLHLALRGLHGLLASVPGAFDMPIKEVLEALREINEREWGVAADLADALRGMLRDGATFHRGLGKEEARTLRLLLGDARPDPTYSSG
ncbi:hypothetical protein CYMTET_38770 [Cymbomonas tetramitiformis]|uniref:Uncharacterized protein n=1 Tax=Cymbomonas tetramitiformis TaxID=36881 RepID=A0AAE0CCL4_9CHLO|nr:hypothetical protein CYMTET_38770 [Cymbomonas tetramitiformis]